MPPLTRPLALLALALVACAPALPTRLQAPDVRLQALELVGAGLQSQEFLATLQVANPNPVPLPLDGLQIDLDVNGRQLAQAEAADDSTVPAGGESTVQVAAATSLLDLAGELATLAQGQDVSYALTGSALVAGLVRVQLPFAETGRLRLTTGPSGIRLLRIAD